MNAANYRELAFKRMLRERSRIAAYLQKAALIGCDFSLPEIAERIEALREINETLAEMGAFDGCEEIEVATKITLRDWNEREQIIYLWYCVEGYPAGREIKHVDDLDSDEEYCNFLELDFLNRFWGLEGAIENGQWCWDGVGDVRDERGNKIWLFGNRCRF